ncbi:MAG: tetratricopeptide repeat protein [Candidatus Solibacter sp.]
MFALITLPWVACVLQASDEWVRWMERGHLELTCLDFSSAAGSYQNAVRLIEDDPSRTSDLLLSLNAVAMAHKQMGRLAESERESLRALEIAKSAGLGGGSTHAYLLSNLGAIEIIRGAYGKARQHLAEAIEIDSRGRRGETTQLAVARQLLSQVVAHEGKYDEAEILLKQAIATLRVIPGAPLDLLPFALDGLGSLHDAQGRPQESLAAFQDALALFEKTFGSDHPILVLTLNNLGVQSTKTGHIPEARAAFARAAAILDHYEKTDPATAASILSNYAAFLHLTGSQEQGTVLARRAASIRVALPVDISKLEPVTLKPK